ncbi:kinase-like protein, partial [Rhizophagus irregularis]
QFNNVKIIGSGGFGKVFRANWRNTGNILALKEFKYNTAVKEIINEVKCNCSCSEFFNKKLCAHNYSLLKNKKFMIVMEYADGGSLRNYLKLNFSTLTWDNKYQFAYQISKALECLHNEEILHRDLNSNNIFVHQNRIKLGDFGLSKRIEEISKSGSETIGVIPYIDPNKFEQKNYKFNKKSDIYSLGVILWEISSGKPPF